MEERVRKEWMDNVRKGERNISSYAVFFNENTALLVVVITELVSVAPSSLLSVPMS